MKKTSSFTPTLLIFLTLVFLPNTFAQGVLSEPSVRLVYFLPSDRPARPDRITALRELIKDVQEFYAEQMESHGYGRKTFNIETDANGTPVVHRINGKFREFHYYTGTSDYKIWEELFEHFDDLEHVYLIAADLSQETFNDGDSCGLGSPTFVPSGGITPVFLFTPRSGAVAIRHRDITQKQEVIGGSLIIPASGDCFEDNSGAQHRLRVTTHELGHAFGLDHDFREGRWNNDTIMGGRGFHLSSCAAEWLSVSRFFNTHPISANAPGAIKLLSTPTYSPAGINLQFEVTDAEGLHQAQLIVPENLENGSWGPYRLFDCKRLNGKTSTVEFINPELAIDPVDRVTLQIIDVNGNITWATFLTDIASLLPRPKVVSIPDRNLAAAVRKALGLGANAPITDQAMQRLTRLEARESQIKNLTGLEHATQLTELYLYQNQIRNISPLAGLTRLKRLGVDVNQISNITPLVGLTQLELLHIGANQINNQGVQRLSNLTQLRWLSLYGNQISDIKPLASLTKLQGLWLDRNQIRDVSPLAELVNLETLQLGGNPIQDTSPLVSLTKLRDIDIDIPDPQPNSGNVPPEPAVPVPPAEPVPVKDVVSIPDRTSAVPTTGAWLFVHKPSNLTPDNFTIGPGEFAILVHQGKRNVIKKADFKTYASYYAPDGDADFPNLAHFFQNGGRIELVSHASLNPLPRNTKEPQFGDIVISEIMWGLNRSSSAKQFIELYNASAHTYTFWNGDMSFRFSKASESPLPDRVFPFPSNPNAHTKVVDRVSNKGWKVPGKSGNIEKNEPLVSMYREIKYTAGTVPDGTVARSWKASKERVNLPAPSYGTPGARHLPPRPVVLVEASQRPPIYWIDADAGTLHRLVGDEVENLAPNVKNATSLAVDTMGGKLYWTEKTGERTGRIRGASLDGTNVQLVNNLTSVPLNIALDTSSGKIYLTNIWEKVQRLNFDGSNFQPNLITDLKSPKHLTLDVAGGKIYWTEGGERIHRANLDGSGVQSVATGLTAPLSLAVASGKVYWTSARRLHRANLDGTNRGALETLPSAPTSIAVDLGRNLLYLTLPTGEIHRRNLDGSEDQPVVTSLASPSNIVLGISATDPVSTDTPAPPAEPAEDTAADVNQDKKVNKTDLLLVVTALGESPPANPNFDVNADGTVNIADVLLVIEALDDPVAAAAPSFGETLTALDPGRLAMQIDILRAESDGSMKYEHAIAFFQSLLASIRPTETQLLANYPNPFNPETWIPYQLAKASDVRVTIYDGRGVVVRQLVLGHQAPGFYTSRSRAAYWDGRNALGERVASGIYFYQLQAAGVSSLRKMLILK